MMLGPIELLPLIDGRGAQASIGDDDFGAVAVVSRTHWGLGIHGRLAIEDDDAMIFLGASFGPFGIEVWW